jgi:hypothetical protein
MLLKRRADLLIDGKYRRITIWDALDWKQNRPDLWEEYKNNIYSICKKPENKVRMVFQIGKMVYSRIAILDIIMPISKTKEKAVRNHIDMNFLKNVYLGLSV